MGSAACQFSLGLALENDESVIHFKRSAIQGHAQAQLSLAWAYQMSPDCTQKNLMALCLQRRGHQLERAAWNVRPIQDFETEEEEDIVDAICGYTSSPEVAQSALEWLLTQDPDEAAYFLQGSSLLKSVKREVEALLPMPISEEIIPHLIALGHVPGEH